MQRSLVLLIFLSILLTQTSSFKGKHLPLKHNTVSLTALASTPYERSSRECDRVIRTIKTASIALLLGSRLSPPSSVEAGTKICFSSYYYSYFYYSYNTFPTLLFLTAASPSEAQFTQALSTLILVKDVLAPVKKYEKIYIYII